MKKPKAFDLEVCMSKNVGVQYRQGDVFIERIEQLPENVKKVARDSGRVVLAYGEVTGHAYAIADADVELFENEDVAKTDRFLVIGEAIKNGASLIHEEHSTITLDPGIYRVRRQREYVPRDIPSFVAD